MRILHITPTYYPAHCYGGPIQSVHALCRYLSHSGCDVRILTTNSNGPTVLDIPADTELAMEDGIRVVYCQRTCRPDLSTAMLRRMTEMVGWADLVHVTYVFSASSLAALGVAGLLGRPVVISPRGSLQPYGLSRRPFAKRLWMAACRRASTNNLTVHVTSEEEKQDVGKVWPDLPCSIVPNGVDAPDHCSRPKRGHNLRILFLGRLHPIKAVENLIAACSAVQNVELAIAGAGDDSYVRKLHECVTQAGIQERVRFLGDVSGDSKEKAFQDCDVFALPSHSENFGMVVAEALARGVPVIASRGTPWAKLEQLGCGLHVDNDPGSLSDALTRIQQMPLEQMGRCGRDWMLTEYTWKAQAERMMQVYNRLYRTTAVAAPIHIQATNYSLHDKHF